MSLSPVTFEFELSVILPAYLEEENLRLLLPRLRRVLDAQGFKYEVLVVDTIRPLDRTSDACALSNVTYLNRAGGNSFGDAVRTGIAAARGRYLLFMDADGSHSPEFIPELLARRAANDVVIASRYIDGGFTENSKSLIWMSRVLNFSYSLVLNLKCKDVSNSFKIYRAEQLRSLRLTCNNFDIIQEILFKLSQAVRGFKVAEVPFSFKKRMFGETKRNLARFILTYLFTILKLRLLSLPVPARKKLPSLAESS